MVATLQVHDVILVCDDCPRTYRNVSCRSRPLFALMIRNNLSNKPDVENRILDCLQIWVHRKINMRIPVVVRSKLWVCGRSLAGIGGSNPAGGANVCYECCVLSELSATVELNFEGNIHFARHGFTTQALDNFWCI